MARITIEDCQKQIGNRFLIIQMACKRVSQYRNGYKPLITCKNKEIVTALREIAGSKVLIRPASKVKTDTNEFQD